MKNINKYYQVIFEIEKKFPILAKTMINIGMPIFEDCGNEVKTSQIHFNSITNQIEFIWNQSFFDSLTNPEIRFVILHELLHLTLAHCKKNTLDKQVYALACDIVVNDTINENYAQIAKMPQICANVTGPNIIGFSAEKLSAENVYKILMEQRVQGKNSAKLQQILQTIGSFGQDKGEQQNKREKQEEEQKNGNEQSQEEPENRNEQEELENGDEQDQEEQESGNKQDQEGQEKLENEQKDGHDKEKQEKLVSHKLFPDEHTKWPIFTEEKFYEIYESLNLLDPRLERGFGESGLSGEVQKKHNEFSLRYLIKNIVGKKEEEEYIENWRRYNPKLSYIYPDIIIPYQIFHENRAKLTLLFSIDVSGSIDNKILQEFLSIAREHSKDFDTVCITFDSYARIYNLKSNKIKYGGGTDYQNMVNFVFNKQKFDEEFDVVFVLTDGCGGNASHKKLDPKRWFWIIAPDGIEVNQSMGKSVFIPKNYLK